MELMHVALSPANIGFTVLLLLIVLYWITVILGVLDVELFNIELPESDFETDADVDVGGEGIFRPILNFFYIGEVPVMILVSIFIMSIWACTILGNYHFNSSGSFIGAMPVYLGAFVISVFCSKFFAMPLRKIYSALNKDYNAPRSVLGRICRVISTEVSKQRMGQSEVQTKGAPIVLNVFALGDHVFNKGDEAVVAEKDETRGVYYIAPVDLEV